MFKYEEPEEYRRVKNGDVIPVDTKYVYDGEGHPASAVQVGGSHYKDMKITPREYAIANGLGIDEFNVIKYVSRHKRKNGLEDINKAIHYLELLKGDVYERD
jgi:hypothetical protein